MRGEARTTVSLAKNRMESMELFVSSTGKAMDSVTALVAQVVDFSSHKGTPKIGGFLRGLSSHLLIY